ncbi:MAG TPA: DegT/DnrJ/EryC1/StrS family aminotransferase [Ktedonobacterales bacterium]|nr:DegT/DnrJ/EryC1/StrS family aminotransferase [Ktedonobacterales bacterium]
MAPIPLLDLKAQYQGIRTEILEAIERVLEGMTLFLGPEQAAFEREFASYCSSAHGVGVSNGTDALNLALRACGVGPGDEVITVSNTFIATVEAITLVGAHPVFVDVDPQTYTMDYRQLAEALTPNTRAIMPVHLYGHAADMDPIMAFAREHQLIVIEDASQAQGATYKGRPVGGIGDIGCFSLYYSKNLGAYGEAGICVTNNADYATAMRTFRDHGSRVRYQHEIIGTNARMDEIQAAVLRVKLPHLDDWNELRRQHAATYTEALRDVVIATPQAQPWAGHVYYVYVIRVADRDRVRRELEAQGVLSGIHYPIPCHLQPACASLGYTHGSFPVTEAQADQILSIPMYPEMTSEQLDAVIGAVKQACSAGVSSQAGRLV